MNKKGASKHYASLLLAALLLETNLDKQYIFLFTTALL